jgi:uncharacterized protein with PhoU and TrkA domain
MKNRPGKTDESTREQRLVEALRERPELMERFEAILALTDSEEGALRSADDIEELLVEEVRRLGHGAMEQWAKAAEERSARALRKIHPQARLKKKRT